MGRILHPPHEQVTSWVLCPNCSRAGLKYIAYEYIAHENLVEPAVIHYVECQWCGEEYTKEMNGRLTRLP